MPINIQLILSSGNADKMCSSTAQTLVPNATGHVVCPECQVNFNCRPGGIQNFHKTHVGLKHCREGKVKLDKERAKKKDCSIFSFMHKKPKPVPSLVSAPPLVHSSSSLEIGTPSSQTLNQHPLTSRPSCSQVDDAPTTAPTILFQG
jgi:hypothetical protein